jgi:hypothetical protein
MSAGQESAAAGVAPTATLANCIAQGNKSGAPSFYGLLADVEAMRVDLDCALTTIDAGLVNRGGDGGALQSAPWRLLVDARCRRFRSGRGSISNRRRHCHQAKRALLHAVGLALTGQALSINRRPGRSARHPRARARRPFADAGNA